MPCRLLLLSVLSCQVRQLVVWAISADNINKLYRITNTSSKIIGLSIPNLSVLIDTAIIHRAKTIISNLRHPLNYSCFTPLPSGRRYSYPTPPPPTPKKSTFGKNDLASAIRMLNSQKLGSVLYCFVGATTFV